MAITKKQKATWEKKACGMCGARYDSYQDHLRDLTATQFRKHHPSVKGKRR